VELIAEFRRSKLQRCETIDRNQLPTQKDIELERNQNRIDHHLVNEFVFLKYIIYFYFKCELKLKKS